MYDKNQQQGLIQTNKVDDKCQNPKCNNHLSGRRTKYCSEICRFRASSGRQYALNKSDPVYREKFANWQKEYYARPEVREQHLIYMRARAKERYYTDKIRRLSEKNVQREETEVKQENPNDKLKEYILDTTRRFIKLE